ncbi:28945_t:CDS:1, partial [Racocetra persica]
IENSLSQDIKNKTVFIEIFEFAYLENGYKVIIRASPNYHSQVVFSDVCVEMDKSEQEDYLMNNGL